MLKKLLFFCMIINVYAMSIDDDQGMSKRTKVILGGVIIVGGIAAAPFVLPAATITAIQAAAATAAANIAAASATASATVGTTVTAVAGPTIGGAAASVTAGMISVPSVIGLGIAGAQVARPYVFETEEEELLKLKKAEAAELLQVKTNFRNCLIKNKNGNKGNFACAKQCQDTAYKFGLLAGKHELEKLIKEA